MSQLTVEILIAVVLIILLALLANPLEMVMTHSTEMMVVIACAVLFAVFASFVWREKVNDEREMLHRMLADRIGFLAGSGILALGILLQGFQYRIDRWLIWTLGLMVLAKIGGLIYSRWKY